MSSAPLSSPSTSSLGVQIGAGVGVPAGLALAGALSYIIYLLRRHRKNQRLLKELVDQNQDHTIVETKFELPDQPLSLYSGKAAEPSEIAEGSVLELGGTDSGGIVVAELPGDGADTLPEKPTVI